MAKSIISEPKLEVLRENWNLYKKNVNACLHPPFRDQEQKKENRKKTGERQKKTKESRMEFNYKAVLQMIAPQHEWSVLDPIHPGDLNLEAIAGLSKHKKPYIAFAFQQNVLTHAAQNTIKEHLSFRLDDEDEGTESLNASINSTNDEDMSTDDSINGDSEDTDDFDENN